MARKIGTTEKRTEPISRDELHLAFAQVPHTIGVISFDRALRNPSIRWGLEKMVMVNRRRGRHVRTIQNFND